MALPSGLRTAFLWVLAALLAAFFLLAGVSKLAASSSQVASFLRWGYPGWFIYVVGFLESAGGVGLLIPRMAGFSAVVLGATMIGALLTHLLHGELEAAPVPLVLLCFLSALAYGRRDALVSLAARLRQRS